MKLRAELRAIVDALLSKTAPGDEIALDVLGDAIGARAIAQDEIDAMLSELERYGRKIASPATTSGEDALKRVIATARALRLEHGRAPRAEEIAEHAGIPLRDVQHALSLVRIMQR